MAKPSTSGKVKAPLRCASPEPEEDTFGRLSSRARDEDGRDGPPGNVGARKAKRRKKEFAWMDSDDEASDNSNETEEDKAEKNSPKAQEKPSKKSDSDVEERRKDSDEEPIAVPSSASEVQSLVQMMRLMESWQRQRGKILRLPMAELAQVCLACARVKYFDSQSFADIIAAVKVHLRSYIQLKADDVGGVLSGLADVNAYDKELFELAASALNRTAGHLQRPARKVILDAFKKVKHRSENSSLREMSEQEAKARYEERCSEVAASWQRPGACSTTWRGFG